MTIEEAISEMRREDVLENDLRRRDILAWADAFEAELGKLRLKWGPLVKASMAIGEDVGELVSANEYGETLLAGVPTTPELHTRLVEFYATYLTARGT